MDILQSFEESNWKEALTFEQQTKATSALENGKILFFPKLAFELLPSEKKFLSADYAEPKAKNISWDPHSQKLSGMRGALSDHQQLKSLMQRFAQDAHGFIHMTLPHYIGHLEQGRTSFRPVEVRHRKTSYRKDDKRLHVDAFPSQPNQGRRILRIFANINPDGIDRVWRIGEPFQDVAKRFLPRFSKPIPGSASLMHWLGMTKSRRSEYDHLMLQMHDHMKKDETYQQQAPQVRVNFPSNSTWIVQTDHVPHAAMSGQYVLEQTFYLPVLAMMDKAQAPLKILEELVGRSLI